MLEFGFIIVMNNWKNVTPIAHYTILRFNLLGSYLHISRRQIAARFNTHISEQRTRLGIDLASLSSFDLDASRTKVRRGMRVVLSVVHGRSHLACDFSLELMICQYYYNALSNVTHQFITFYNKINQW